MTTSGRLPVKAVVDKVIHESGTHVSWIGLRVRIVCSDGSEIHCEHDHGHRNRGAAAKCAQRIIDRINREAAA